MNLTVDNTANPVRYGFGLCRSVRGTSGRYLVKYGRGCCHTCYLTDHFFDGTFCF